MKSHTIELIAPSGYPQDPETVMRAIGRLAAEGHRLSGIETARRCFERFAGTDDERASDLNRLADPARPLPDIVLAVRGGYGAVRILDRLDYVGLQQRLKGAPLALCGHSDFTAIQMALLAQAGLMTFGGPMLAGNFGALQLSEFTMQHFWSAVNQREFTVTQAVPQMQGVDVSGTLWGGNLAMMTALIGTPYLPNIEGGILFVEDINEPLFRVERMLYQLHLSGILARQQALVLGEFTGMKLSEYDNGYDFNKMVEQIRSVARIPVIVGLRFGHGQDTVTLPIGAHASLRANRQGFALTVSGHPTLSPSGAEMSTLMFGLPLG